MMRFCGANSGGGKATIQKFPRKPCSPWWAGQDSNLQPDRYERPALTIELPALEGRPRQRIKRKSRRDAIGWASGALTSPFIRSIGPAYMLRGAVRGAVINVGRHVGASIESAKGVAGSRQRRGSGARLSGAEDAASARFCVRPQPFAPRPRSARRRPGEPCRRGCGADAGRPLQSVPQSPWRHYDRQL